MSDNKILERGTEYLRIRLKKKDIEKYMGKELPVSVIKHWLQLGRLVDIHTKIEATYQKNLSQKMDDLAQYQESLVFLTVQVFELVCVSAGLAQYEVAATLEAKKKVAQDDAFSYQAAKIARAKSKKFRAMAAELFPKMDLGLLMPFPLADDEAI